MLAEPGLFADVKKVLTQEDFDVPALRQIAGAIYDVLSKKPDAGVNDICGCVEDAALAGLIIELEQQGTAKGNFKKRLNDALSAIEHNRQLMNKELLKPTQDRRNIGIT
jgi:hypothetical protein